MDLLVATSLRRLRAFLVVCDTLHMGRAALRLGVAQPALSQQIRSLEDALGVALFHRRKRGIDLTDAGAAYRDEATRLLSLHQAAADIARRAARGELGSLSIGYVTSAMFDRGFRDLLGKFRQAFPDVALALMEGDIESVGNGLSAGDLDIVLTRAPVPLPPGRAHRVAARETLVVALPEKHRCAGDRSVSLTDLTDEPMIGFNDGAGIGIERVIGDLLKGASPSFRVEWRVSAVTSLLGLVSAGLGYGIVPDGLSRLTIPGVCFRPLREEAQAELWYVWRQSHVSTTLGSWLQMLDNSDILGLPASRADF